jgi:SET and MYND domain-containing protein 4
MEFKNNFKAQKCRSQGNLKYKQNQFYEALISYNKSLCVSRNGSENLGVCFANRSAVYLELKQVDKCLENIELARSHGYQNEARLEEREKKAKTLKETIEEDSANNPAQFFKLSYPANEKIPSIANCLEVHENSQFGRHIVTNKDLNPGDIIAIEEPMFMTISKRARHCRCSNCLKSNMLSLIPCNGSCCYSE